MYKPAPPRPKKTNIVRSRNGCRTCRERKTKCDEKKPVCGTCARLDRPCVSIRPDFKFHNVVFSQNVPQSLSVTSSSRGPKLPLDYNQAKGDVEDEEGGKIPLASIGNLDLIKSLQHSDRDVYYTTYWEDRCLPALHPIFISLSEVTNGQTMLRDSILALASCHFSRQQVERKTLATSHMGNFRPSLTHLTRSHLYYSSAIKEMTRLSPAAMLHNATTVLAALTLFTYIESSVGNFQGFRCHVDGMTQLLRTHPGIVHTPVTNALVMAWMQIRFVNWWSRAYFSSWDVHRRLPSVPLPWSLEGRYDSLPSRRVVVLSILCESHRLNSCKVLGYVGLRECVPPCEEDKKLEECLRLLNEQKRRLDDWFAHLPPLELPISEHSDPIYEWAPTNIDGPICFQSHDAALNFAYYTLARVMQCHGLLYSLHDRDHYRLAYDYEEEERWTRLLIRIVKGTCIQTSLGRNNYTIGFQGLLLAALLRCQSPALGDEIQSWVQKLADLQPTEEGSFPIYQSLGVIKAINCQKRAGFDVLGVTQPVDDGGGTPKVTAFNSQPIEQLILHGRSRLTGVPFAICVPLDI